MIISLIFHHFLYSNDILTYLWNQSWSTDNHWLWSMHDFFKKITQHFFYGFKLEEINHHNTHNNWFNILILPDNIQHPSRLATPDSFDRRLIKPKTHQIFISAKIIFHLVCNDNWICNWIVYKFPIKYANIYIRF